MTHLRVATFNIRHGLALDGWNSWPFRRRAVAATIESLHADVVALQEAYRFQLRWLSRRLGEYVVVGTGRAARGGGEHTAVLCRRPRAEILGHHNQWFGETPHVAGSMIPGASFPRVATLVTLELDGGTRIEVANTHLDEHSAERRAASTAQLVGWLDPGMPQIVLGDFNAEPGASALEPLVAAGLRHALPSEAGGTTHQFTGRRDGRRLDHIFVSAAFTVLDAGVATTTGPGRLVSDHWPVFADLEI